MFDNEILRLHGQGLTSAAIANRVGCSASYVRSVVWHQGCDAKPIYDPVVALDQRQRQAARQAALRAAKARRADLEAKRDKAKRALQAAEAKLAELG
ncbi:hypothetical protein [Mycobacterium intracellulare]|uniref:hypothetical protein n=1 Tax=Mycobacterium intracellulare TaxID=1767 RepID=UPI0010422838|nr:hypothetical protein [Mycobacterium intracellulare]